MYQIIEILLIEIEIGCAISQERFLKTSQVEPAKYEDHDRFADLKVNHGFSKLYDLVLENSCLEVAMLLSQDDGG